MSPVTFASLPEEILERVLSLVINTDTISPQPPSNWFPAFPAVSRTPSPSVRLLPLLVCRAWLRIGTPLFYRSVTIRTERTSTLLASTLQLNPELGPWVRSLTVRGTFEGMGEVFKLCADVENLDIALDNGSGPCLDQTLSGQVGGESVHATVFKFCEGLGHVKSVKHLVIHKHNQVYMTQSDPLYILGSLGTAIGRWSKLESINFPFRFSPPSMSRSAAAFITSLSEAPNLRSLHTLLPAVWNTALLQISVNPNLTSIHLSQNSPFPSSSPTIVPSTYAPPAILSSNLYLSSARAHPRLIELIRSGTPMFRCRSHTIASVKWPTSPSGSTGAKGVQIVIEDEDGGEGHDQFSSKSGGRAPRRLSAV